MLNGSVSIEVTDAWSGSHLRLAVQPWLKSHLRADTGLELCALLHAIVRAVFADDSVDSLYVARWCRRGV